MARHQPARSSISVNGAIVIWAAPVTRRPTCSPVWRSSRSTIAATAPGSDTSARRGDAAQLGGEGGDVAAGLVVDGDQVAAGRQPPRDGLAEPAARPGDQRDGHQITAPAFGERISPVQNVPSSIR
ncbi:hypothetical protein LUX57_37975 [Actinomadura madurae]|nr:hypothetical protein [Actinomadura madurae]MCP9970261.1 hypothetical protein [Actinomadura madurae]